MPIQGESTLVLIPLLDSLNHENHPDTKLHQLFNTRTNMLDIYSIRDFASDQEATINYLGNRQDIGNDDPTQGMNTANDFRGYGFVGFENGSINQFPIY